MFTLLQCDEIGMTLTESLAMHPAASVSGFYLAHPQAQYFNVGRIGDDQVQDMATRRGVAVKELGAIQTDVELFSAHIPRKGAQL